MDEGASVAQAETTPATDDLGAEVRAAIGRLYRRFRADRADGDLGDAAMGVLTRLHKQGPQTLKALSEHDRVTPASMSQIVNRLASAGWVVRESDPGDGRRVLFTATPAGSELVLVDRAKRRAWLDTRLSELGEEDRAVLSRAAVLIQHIADS